MSKTGSAATRRPCGGMAGRCENAPRATRGSQRRSIHEPVHQGTDVGCCSGGAAVRRGARQRRPSGGEVHKGDRKPPYTVGWANIYSVPTWMKQTQGTLEEIFNQLKAKGLTGKLVVT